MVITLARRTPRRIGVLAGLATLTAMALVLFGLFGARPQPADAVTQSAGKRPLVVFIGNSFTGGSAMDSGGIARYPSLLSAELGFRWMTLTSDGAGYAAVGAQSRQFVDLAAQVPKNATVVIILGSDDDASHPAADIRAGAAQTYARIHDQAPGAVILAVASPWGERPAPKGILTARNAVKDAALQDGNAFVDPIDEKWWVSGPPGQIGADGVHPTDVGHAEVAKYLSPILTKLLPAGSD